MLKQHHNIPSSYVFSLDRRETVPLLSDDERKAAAQHSEAEFLRQFHALREARRRAKALAAGAHSVSQTSAGRAASGSPTIAITTSAQAKPVIFVKVTSPVCNEEPSKKPFHLDIVHHTITKETGSIISEYPNLPSIYSSPSRTIHSNSKGKEPERPSHRLELPVPVVGQEQDHASITLTSNTVNNVNLNDLPRVSPVSTSNRAANASSPSIGQAIPTDPVDVNVLEGQETTKNNLDSNEALRRSPPPSSSSSGSVAFVPCSALTKLGNPCRCPGKFPVPPQPPVSSSNALGLNLGGPALPVPILPRIR
ncbi:uncharacterized protein EI90DRAFT_1977348 [Cantharellus anzutake]|uniref:uncharacterized protein n=1 Tax=Cantharellus anzutake TaxID=1750568 RepID=UPI001902C4E2|nr:uncharacterized protein EI90DRAFT_1977348 [Cantharellus anzutake]KAF8325988.1 hypothetical protein EI90DRAFT_1977348 [Cantharellus anzutake]